MQHALLVRVVDRVGDLTGVVERARQIERAIARDNRLERLAGNELHHDEEDVLLLFGGQNRDDVRVVEGGEQPRLTQQLTEIDALFVRDLERDLLIDPGVFREVNRSKAAAADRLEDFVFADDLAAEEHLRGSIAASRLRTTNLAPPPNAGLMVIFVVPAPIFAISPPIMAACIGFLRRR